MAAIVSLGSAMLRVDPAGSTFTSSHLIFARLCLEARAYTAALPILDQNIFYFPPITNKAGENSMFPYLCSNHDTASTFMTPDSGLTAKLEYRDHLQYFLYGAMIYMGLKEWKRALFFLETVIVSPVANNASKIQVEAYKKWILVNILYKGRVSRAAARSGAAQRLINEVAVAVNAKNNRITGCKTVSCARQGIRSLS